MSTKKSKKTQDYEERIRQASSVLSLISEDNTTPRNIRRAAKKALDLMGSQDPSLAIRVANAISVLDEISQDPNMPPYTRTRIWNVVSILEVIKG
jgi:hypothetical protein